MKKFKFRLEKVLAVKIAREREIQYELSKVVAVQNRFRIKQDELRDSLEAQKQKLNTDMARHSLAPAHFIMFQRYRDHALKSIDDAQNEIEKIQPEVDRIKRILTEAIKERRSIEKLREKQLFEWKRAVEYAAQKESDDINQKIAQRRFLEYAGG